MEYVFHTPLKPSILGHLTDSQGAQDLKSAGKRGVVGLLRSSMLHGNDMGTTGADETTNVVKLGRNHLKRLYFCWRHVPTVPQEYKFVSI